MGKGNIIYLKAQYCKNSKEAIFIKKRRIAMIGGSSFFRFCRFASEQINGDVAGTVDVGGNRDVLLEK